MPIVLLCVVAATAQQERGVCINEFMASNSTFLADDGGQYDDWIELFNSGRSPVDIGGMILTDDLDELTKWRIPNDRPDLTVIPAGGYALIWADKDAGAPGLHAEFALSGEGEELALVDSDGSTIVDYVAFGAQDADLSFGRYPDGGPDWAFVTIPTPGTANAQSFAGVVADVTFSRQHGFCDAPFTVTLSTATDNAQIWYALDGLKPQRTQKGEMTGMLYRDPLDVDSTTCICAIAAKPGWKDSNLTSSTYIFMDDIPGQLVTPQEPAVPSVPSRLSDRGQGRQTPGEQAIPPAAPALKAALQALPSVCIVIEPNDFFDPTTGINANPMQRGSEWERSASIEWIDPEDGLLFQVNAGLRIHGGISRNNRSEKHSLRILFKGQYGPPVLDAPLFKDSDITRFDSLVLRNTFHDSWIGSMGGRPQYMRDQFSRETMRDMGRLTPYGRPVHVYINGGYWGLFILVERPDDGFAAAHLGGSKDEYDALKAKSVSDPDPSTMEVVAGDPVAWTSLFALADGGLADQARYDLVSRYLDVPSFIDYMLMIFYIGSTDGPVGVGGPPRNFWAIRPREREGGFVFFAWDLEFSLNNLSENRVTVRGTQDPHHLFQELTANTEFRMLLADHVHRHFFHGVLTPESATERYLARSADVERAIWAEAFRWGASQAPSAANSLCSSWRAECQRIIRDYFPLRSMIVVDQLQQAGLYPIVEPPVFTMDGIEHHGGPVHSGALLTVVNPNDGGIVYCTVDGSDPRAPQRAVDANTLVTLVPADAAKRVFVPVEDIGTAWTGGQEPYDDADWTAGIPVTPGTGGAVGYVAGRLKDSRISYNLARAMSGHASCYIRIPFQLTAADLAQISHLALRVQCDDGFVAYVNGVEVASVNRPAVLTWSAQCADRSESAGFLWAGIPKGVELLNPGENILAVHALDYGADAFLLLSIELFGGEHRIVGEDVSASAKESAGPLKLTTSGPIKARVLRGGTWSPLTDAVFAVGPVTESLRITEIMYHPPEPGEEFIELANLGTETINLNGVRFVAGIDFVFPGIELAPREVTLIVRDIEAFKSCYGSDLDIAGQYEGALDNAGERVRLHDAIGRPILDFRYEDDWYNLTDGAGYSLVCSEPFPQDPNAFSDGGCWSPSIRAGGSPGVLEIP